MTDSTNPATIYPTRLPTGGTVRQDILRFLRDPLGFADDVDAADAALWSRAMTDFAQPAIAATADYALRPAQEMAWRGLARVRTGLVLGPPGTGKTHLLAWLVAGHAWARHEAGRPCRTFLTAFTRNAAAHLLGAAGARCAASFAAVGGAPPRAFYLGREPDAGLPPGVTPLPLGGREEVAEALAVITGDRPVILGGTIWALNNLLGKSGDAGLPGREGPTASVFDLVAVDEASQIVLGQGLMALAGLAPEGRVLVAGDDRQLPPVRASHGAVVDGREVGGSLYAFLKVAGVPEFALDETFRLNEPLTRFPERRFYPAAYRSAEPDRRLALSADWRAADGLTDWERVALDPEYPVVVMVHEGPPTSTESPFEVEAASHLARRFRAFLRASDGTEPDAAAFWSKHFALVSPHRAQNAALRAALPAIEREHAFVETVDRIQGRERDAVLVTYTVSDPEFALAEAEFIFSPERLNVAATRSRSKLVVLVSRRLLDALPTDQETLDKAEVLREFVFSCPSRGTTTIPDGRGGTVLAEIRVRTFGDAADVVADLAPRPEDARSPLASTTDTLDGRLSEILTAVRRIALASPYGNAALNRLEGDLARPPGLFRDLRRLHALGWVNLEQRRGSAGPARTFWVVRPLDMARPAWRVDAEPLLPLVEEAIRANAHRPRAAFYDRVRSRFLWMDETGAADVFAPRLDALVRDGLVARNGDLLRIVEAGEEAETAGAELPTLLPLPSLSDDDFRTLNALEDLEVARLGLGVVEGWTSVAALARAAGRNLAGTLGSLDRLEAHGYLLRAAEGRTRSRMAELAREVRAVKQRFEPEDARRRPYLVRSLKVRVRDRNKPTRDIPLAEALTLADPSPVEVRALDALGTALRGLWGAAPAVAGFQARGFAAILAAWRGRAAPNTFVIAADTGSGKTEAGVLPLIAGATADAMEGMTGTRAILTYPRIRLASNQAQRLARYLAALDGIPEAPSLTLGLQFGPVPRSLGSALREDDIKAGWAEIGDGVYRFPFFACPSCGAELHLHHGRGLALRDARTDRLACTACEWSYDGWVGSKQGIARTPPTFLLPTVDSVHQWLHDRRYGAVFGDGARAVGPRAVLADEIHLYAGVHGAQVGHALRRLLTRAEVNDPAGRSAIAIGMSATLGQPALALGRLLGRPSVHLIAPNAEGGETPVTPRGREYFYFVQPEVESRGKDVAGASTTIQTLMCLAHGMRRRTGAEGGHRSLVFLDSIDKVRRLQATYRDAEEGKELALLRTTRYPADPATGAVRGRCCGEPHGCDRFADAECWFFAATDGRQRRARSRQVGSDAPAREPTWFPGRRLAVAPTPVFSGTEGRVEDMIKASDVVFATSSLEVGYDDPDIALVYQHYAPQNLASFTQRRGRGGRGAEDRPITAVTLSLYSPRDTYWYARPDRMIDPDGFQAPLNLDNHFVLRGQILAALLDAVVRHEAATGIPAWTAAGRPSPQAFLAAEGHVQRLFGAQPWTRFGVASLQSMWTMALSASGHSPPTNSVAARNALPWIPRFLSDTVNLPALNVVLADRAGGAAEIREDIALVFGTAAPGNVTRRFDAFAAHWRPPIAGRAPWLDPADEADAERVDLFDGDPDRLLEELPLAARQEIGPRPHSHLLRPRRMTLQRVGAFARDAATWTPHVVCHAAATPTVGPFADGADPATGVRHESRGALRSFTIVRAETALGARDLPRPLGDWDERFARVEAFVGNTAAGHASAGTGLTVAHVAWGADAELRLIDPRTEPVTFCQTFVDRADRRPLLHGYAVEAEGLRFHLETARLDAFVEAEWNALAADEAARRWHLGQMMRYLVESRARASGVGGYDARRGADLFAAAAADPDLRAELGRLLRYWDETRLEALFLAARDRLLSQHPLLTTARVRRVAANLSGPSFAATFAGVLAEVRDPAAVRGYLRSVVLHSLAVRLHQLVVTVAQADDRQVVVQAKLPIQFGVTGHDVVTIAERGADGDGTTRAFIERFAEALRLWTDGFGGECPNADEDALVDRFFAAGTPAHERWLRIDPSDPAAMAAFARELQGDLRGDGADVLPASMPRLLFGVEAAEQEEFRTFDLAVAVRATREILETRLGRRSSAWELASEVARRAADPASGAGVLNRLFDAYASMPEVAGDDENFTPAARVADQVQRLGGRLCADGCQACLHQTTGLMSDSLTEATVSRRLLCRFLGNAEGA